MQGTFESQLYACGKKPLPQKIVFDGDTYRLQKVFKHDFFAATALYELPKISKSAKTQNPNKIILKLNRSQHLLGLPLAWLGEFLCRHQVDILQRLKNLRGIPHFLSHYGKTGFIYEFIEGQRLDSEKKIPDDFFDKLLNLLREIHQRNVVYLDLNKKDNIIIGSDGRPYLIDFQISLYIPKRLLLSRRLSKYLKDNLQAADIYHLFKHKCKLSPELLRPEEQKLSQQVCILVRLHRHAATPLRELRRALLKFLLSKGLMKTQKIPPHSQENKADGLLK